MARSLSVLVFCFLLFCLAGTLQAAPTVFIFGDMEKSTGDEQVQSSPSFFQGGTVTLHGAGNEVVAFQILLAAGYPLGSAAWGGSANSDGTVSGISA